MANENLKSAKKNKNDEFYTQYEDIQKEVNAYLEYNPDTFKDKTVLLPCDDPEWSNFTRFFAQNFENLKLKKLISTSFSAAGKCKKYGDKDADGYYQLSLFEEESPQFDRELSVTKGKIFILDRDTNSSGKIDIDALEWHYLDGDGDFKSKEVKALRNEADVIVTNPPFSLFREFLAWIVEADKKFLIIGSKNVITYKEVFPLIKENKLWVGTTSFNKDMLFIPPTKINPSEKASTATRIVDGIAFLRSPAVWFTNLDHGRRHHPLQLMTIADNLKFSRHKEIKENGYHKYDNYDAIEVPFTDSIPSDYDGIIGVPITFLDKYCPEQFEIVGMESSAGYNKEIVGLPLLIEGDARPAINGKTTYARIFIRRK